MGASDAETETFDVAVVGGGSAGVAAALAAADRGARTVLLERSDILGGNATNAFVHTICGLYLPADATDGGAVHAHPGLPSRFARALERGGAAGPAERAGRVHVLPTEPTRMAACEQALCAERGDLSVVLGASVEAVELATAESRITSRTMDGERSALLARAVVDATGDAAVASLGGAETLEEPGDALQFPSYIFRMRGVDTREIEGFGRMRLTHAVAGAARSGDLPPGCESVLVRRALAPGCVYVTLNVPKPADAPYDPLDDACREALEKRAGDHARALERFLRDTRPAFAGAEIDALPRRIGVRETRRVRGREVVSEQDVLSGRRRDDEVALSTWPIELWHDHRRARFAYPEGPCSIPLGALASASHPRLGVAGRCVSASHEALGALRVIGTALAMGEAIGTASALAVDRGVGVADVPAADVRATIEGAC